MEASVICQVCGTGMAGDSRYCRMCGAALVRRASEPVAVGVAVAARSLPAGLEVAGQATGGLDPRPRLQLPPAVLPRLPMASRGERRRSKRRRHRPWYRRIVPRLDSPGEVGRRAVAAAVVVVAVALVVAMLMRAGR